MRKKGRSHHHVGRVLLLVVLLAVSLPATVRAQEPAWEVKWETAFIRAKVEKKLVFVDFWASWCGPCLRMDAETFPDHRVSRLLDDFVLLKVDIDRQKLLPAKYRVRSFPSYLVFDPWENVRFRFTGFHEGEDFAKKLELVDRGADLMVRGSEMLQEQESAEAWLMIGHAYLHAWDTRDARDAYGKARRLAGREKNRELAQMAEIQLALALGMEGKTEKSARSLHAIAAQPVAPACKAASLVALGRVHQLSGDRARAEKAFREALESSPGDSAIRRDAEMALASLAPESR